MKARKIIAGGAAATLLGSGLALAPAVVASPESAVVVTAEAAQGWGGVCRTTYYRTGSWSNWWIYTTTTYRWFSSSLTGTDCLRYSSSKSYVWKG